MLGRSLERVILPFGGRFGREVAFELLVGWAVDADAGVPLGFAAALGRDGTAAIENRIAFKADRVPAAVADPIWLSLLEFARSLT